MSKFLAIIPARYGSKGIPHKNLLKINGLSLVERAIQSAKKSSNNLKVILSSDSSEILEIADKYNIIKHLRMPKLASDTASTGAVVKDILLSTDINASHVIVLQPTSPFRTENHIDHAIKLMNDNAQCDGLVSVCKDNKEILKSFYINDLGYIKGTHNDDAPFAPRQSLPDVYKANGAIFIVKSSIVRKEAKLYGSKMIPFLMDRDSSIDIDTLYDLRNIDYELHVEK